MIGEVSFYAGHVAWLLPETNRRIDPTNPLEVVVLPVGLRPRVAPETRYLVLGFSPTDCTTKGFYQLRVNPSCICSKSAKRSWDSVFLAAVSSYKNPQ